MEMAAVKCPVCEGTDISKNGKGANGIQRYICNNKGSCPTVVKTAMRSKPKLQNINDKPDNQVMHFDRFGKADGFSA